MTTEILSIDEIIDSQGDKFITHNRGLRQLEGQQTRVLSRTISTPPASPALGDTYIVPAGSLAPWDTHQDEIAHWYDPDGGSSPQWNYYDPVEGAQLVWVNDEDRLVVWDGTEWRIAGDLAVQDAVTIQSVAGTLTLDLDVSDHFIVPLTENVTNIVVNNAPPNGEPFDFFIEWIQTAAYTVTWPSIFRWSNSTSPTITVTAGNADIHYHVCRDNANNIWSHEFTINTSQDALQLVGISQYVHIALSEDSRFNGVTGWSTNVQWRGGTQYGLLGPGSGDASHGAYDNSGNRAYQSCVLPGRETGKYYIEFIAGPFVDNVPDGAYSFGVTVHQATYAASSNFIFGPGNSKGAGLFNDGTVRANGAVLGVLSGPWIGGDRLMLAFDLDNRLAYFGINGTWTVGDPNTETGGISWNADVSNGNVDEVWYPAFGELQTGSTVSTQMSVARTTIHQRPIQFQPYADRNQLFYQPDFTGPNRRVTHIGHIVQDCHFNPADNPGEYKNFANVFSAVFEYSLESLVTPPLGSCRLQWPAAAHPLQSGTDYVGPAYNVIQPNTGKWYWLINGGMNLDLEIGLVDLAFVVATTKPSTYVGTAAVWNNTTGSTWLNGVLQGAATPPNTNALGTAILAYDSNTGLMWIKSVNVVPGDAPWDLAGNPDSGANPVWNLGAPVPMQIVVWLSTTGQITYAQPNLYFANSGFLGNNATRADAPTLDNAQTFRPLALEAY